MSDRKIEAVTINQTGDDSPVNNLFATAAVVGFGFPYGNRLMATASSPSQKLLICKPLSLSAPQPWQ
jgi:hypothetical protein